MITAVHAHETFAGDEDYAICAVHNVLVFIWHGDITRASLESSREAGLEMNRRFPKGIGSFIVAREGIPLPSANVREMSEANMREASQWVREAAIVIEGEGFWSSAARSVYTAMVLFSRVPYGQKVFSEVRPAGAWLGQTLEDAPPPAEIERVITAVRARFA
jgi:hypothetical protein